MPAGGTAARPRTLEASIGEEVRAARSIAGLTLQELSNTSGVSAAMISKIERAQVSASISTLNSIAVAVGVPVANFFASTVEQREISFVRSGEGISIERTGSTYGHAYKMIGRVASDGTLFESYAIRLERPSTGEPWFQHAGIEFIHVTKGTMTYRCGDADFELGPGDSLTFETRAPHGPVELLTSEVEFLTVIARPMRSDMKR